MTHFLLRRRLLQAGLLLPALPALARGDGAAALAALEREAGGRLGVAALNTATGARLDHRADERFPLCSTFKTLVAAAMLARSVREPGWLDTRIRWTAADLVAHAPVTGRHVAGGLTVAELCEAVVTVSDNPAANLLMKTMGGPQALTAWVRTLGDETFRLDRWETELNSAIPGDPRDTSTPAAMAATLRKLVLGDALPPAQRARLTGWLLANTTGNAQIRAGMPGWKVADKTGAGQYGATNDTGVAWTPGGQPVVLAIYYTPEAEDAPNNRPLIARAAAIVARELG